MTNNNQCEFDDMAPIESSVDEFSTPLRPTDATTLRTALKVERHIAVEQDYMDTKVMEQANGPCKMWTEDEQEPRERSFSALQVIVMPAYSVLRGRTLCAALFV